MNLNIGQDWNEVVLTRKTGGTGGVAGAKAVRAALQTGGDVDTSKKYEAGGNKAGTTGTGMSARKLEDETEDFNVQRVPTELKKQIMKARLAKGLTQAQLAQQINEKPQIIQEYESGKAIPNPQILSKMSRVLGVPLSKNGPKAAAPPKQKKGVPISMPSGGSGSRR